jgi:hypothetical protein
LRQVQPSDENATPRITVAPGADERRAIVSAQQIFCGGKMRGCLLSTHSRIFFNGAMTWAFGASMAGELGRECVAGRPTKNRPT